MATLIAEVGAHRQQLRERLAITRGPVRVASAYVTETGVFPDVGGRDIRLLTSLSAMDIISGATSLDSLETLIRSGVQCRFLSGIPKFHAKVYIFGDDSAIITSANFTARALDSNIEVGVRLGGSEVGELIGWFDGLWDSAESLDAARLSDLRQRTAELRQDFASFRHRCRSLDRADVLSPVADAAQRNLIARTPRFFLCNTNRKELGQMGEDLMRSSRFALAWEEFRFTSHMEAVRDGDVILLYANQVGVIGLGRAVGPCEVLEPNDPRRVSDDFDSREWRIPVEWLRWVNERDASPWPGVPPATFQNVSGERWSDHRDRVVRHFFGAPESAREQEVEP